MTRQRTALLAATTAAALLTTASPALADDASVFNAYVARQASEIDPAANAYRRALRKVRRARTTRVWVRRLRTVIRTDRRTNAVLTVVEGELMAQTASTGNGARARRQALREVRAWKRANRFEIRAINRLIDGKQAGFRRWIRRGNRTIGKSVSYGRHAVRRFRQAGLTSPERAITWIN